MQPPGNDIKTLRLSFSPKLPTSVLLSIMGQLGVHVKAGHRAACVKRGVAEFGGNSKGAGHIQDQGPLCLSTRGGVNSVAAVTVFCLEDGLAAEERTRTGLSCSRFRLRWGRGPEKGCA